MSQIVDLKLFIEIIKSEIKFFYFPFKFITNKKNSINQFFFINLTIKFSIISITSFN